MSSSKPPVRVVGALIEHAGLVMVTRRPPGKSQGGLFEFPGGKVEPGETDAEALMRELQEELALTAQVGTLYHQSVHVYGEKAIELLVYRCDIGDQRPVLLEADAVAWARPPALLTLGLTAADVPVAEQLVNDLAAAGDGPVG